MRQRCALVVDDEAAVRNLLAIMLRGFGFRVLEASDGFEAYELFRHTPEIDIVITDIVMPELGGIELGEIVGALRPGTPIIYVSGFATSLPAESANARFIRKPFTAATLLSEVSEVLQPVA